MIVKIWLPEYAWESILKYGGYKEHPDSIEIILRAKFIPRIKEFANDYREGKVEWMRNYYRFVLYGKPCIVSDALITEIYELLGKESLFLEETELEYLLSYFLMVFLAEELDQFYGNTVISKTFH